MFTQFFMLVLSSFVICIVAQQSEGATKVLGIALTYAATSETSATRVIIPPGPGNAGATNILATAPILVTTSETSAILVVVTGPKTRRSQ